MSSPLSSPAFRHWFGDSKVVDARGEPMVVYHGTPVKPFDAFAMKVHDEDSGNQIPFGIHFAEDTEQANVHGLHGEDPDIVVEVMDARYAAERRAIDRLGYKTPSAYRAAVRRSRGNALRDAVETWGDRAAKRARFKLAGGDFRRVIPVYLSIQRPLDARVELKRGTPQLAMAKKMLGSKWRALMEWKERNLRKRRYAAVKSFTPSLQDAIDMSTPSVAFQTIVAAGYDGVFHMAAYPDKSYRTWVAFDPRQIKHATENVGTYDPSDPSMYKNPRGKTSRSRR